MNLFVIRKGKLELDHEEILLYPEFRNIYEADTTEDKLKAFKYFNYIYQIADYKSLPNQEGYSDNEAHDYAVEMADLPIAYRPTKDIIDAIKRYKRERYNVLKESIIELKRSFKSIIKIIGNARKRLEDNIETDSTEDRIVASIEVISKLLTLSNTMNSQIKLLGETLKQLHKEEEESRNAEVRGDKEYSNSLDGDPDIEG
jgi:hypothetical protein